MLRAQLSYILTFISTDNRQENLRMNEWLNIQLTYILQFLYVDWEHMLGHNNWYNLFK